MGDQRVSAELAVMEILKDRWEEEEDGKPTGVAKILQPKTRADMWLPVDDDSKGISIQVKTCRRGDRFDDVVGYGDRPVLCVSYTPKDEGGFCENVTQIDAVYILLYRQKGKGRDSPNRVIHKIRGNENQNKVFVYDRTSD